uniref:protein-serine/threonine phosphatase n=1 Tax=Araucaria cunninghamii TaxID=56994 RepID=A0A0D6R8I6_ARACU
MGVKEGECGNEGRDLINGTILYDCNLKLKMEEYDRRRAQGMSTDSDDSNDNDNDEEMEIEKPPNPMGGPIRCLAPLPVVRSISFNGTAAVNMGTKKNKESLAAEFTPTLRSGVCYDKGNRTKMEDAHICIADLAKNYGCSSVGQNPVAFYGVFDGHGGKGAAHFVSENLPRFIVESSDFPLELEKAVQTSFIETDNAFAEACLLDTDLSSGTTALTVMVSGRDVLVANAGDCRAVLSRHGRAIEMSKDHRPCCVKERKRIEGSGGYVDDDGYLNGQLNVTRALGDWHIEGLKVLGLGGGPLSAEPEMKWTTLTKEDEFLIIGCDGLWEVFTSQNAVDFARRKLQKDNDLDICCKELVYEAIKRETADNLTVIMVSFHSDPPPSLIVDRPQVQRSISVEGLRTLQAFLDSLPEQ